MTSIDALIIKLAKRIAARKAISEFRRGRRWAISYLEKHDDERYVIELKRIVSTRLLNKNDYFERGVKCGLIQYHWRYEDPRIRKMIKLREMGPKK